MSIVVIVSILSIIGLIVFSISQDEYSGFFSAPFNAIILVPSILLAFIILFIPRYTIQVFLFIIHGILMVLLPFTGSSHAGTWVV